MGITKTRLSLVLAERNSKRILGLQPIFAMEMYLIRKSNLVYLEETGFNLHKSQHYGYSPAGQKAYITVPANNGQNVSLLCVISID